MKVNFFTTQPHAACSEFYREGLEKRKNSPDDLEMFFYQTDFNNYDVNLVMTYDYQLLPEIRKKTKGLLGLIDPRNEKVSENAKRFCDFLVVDSIEMEDYWSKIKKPMIRFVEYPEIPFSWKDHKNSDTVKIAYHGNMIHLMCASNTIKPALENLSKKHQIELHIMSGMTPVNIEEWMPKGVKGFYYPWSRSNYEILSRCDIGIAPNNLSINENSHSLTADSSKNYNYSDDDFILRFKMPSNPGRFIIYGRMHLPVVADFYPSALQILDNERTGFVAHSAAAWEKHLSSLIEDPMLRNKMSENLNQYILDNFDYAKQQKRMVSFLNDLKRRDEI